VQHTSIALTYKIKAAGSWQEGVIMVMVFFVFYGVAFVGCVGLHLS
jgi:hypothetical protein